MSMACSARELERRRETCRKRQLSELRDFARRDRERMLLLRACLIMGFAVWGASWLL